MEGRLADRGAQRVGKVLGIFVLRLCGPNHSDPNILHGVELARGVAKSQVFFEGLVSSS